MAISLLSDLDCSLQMTSTAMKRAPVTAVLTDRPSMPHICGLDFEAYATRGIRLERTQTLAGGADHCNFRFSRLEPK
jgi:hypothetical protein